MSDMEKTEKIVEQVIKELGKLYVDPFFSTYLPPLVDRYHAQLSLLQQQTRAKVEAHKDEEKQQHAHEEALKKENEQLKEQVKQLESNAKQQEAALEVVQDSEKVLIKSNEDQITHLKDLLKKLDSLPPAELAAALGPIFLVEHRMHVFESVAVQWKKLLNVNAHGIRLVESVKGQIGALLGQVTEKEMQQKLLQANRELEGMLRLWATIIPDHNTEFADFFKNFQQMEATLASYQRDLMESAHKGQKAAVKALIERCIPVLMQEHELLKGASALSQDLKDNSKEYGKMIAGYKAQLVPTGVLHKLLHPGKN